MHDFENRLKQQPLRRIPAQWRGEILAAAKPIESKQKPADFPWWRAWLWPSPPAWACVGCAWLLVIALTAGSPPPGSAAFVLPQIDEQAFLQQRQLALELFRSRLDLGATLPNLNPTSDSLNYETHPL